MLTHPVHGCQPNLGGAEAPVQVAADSKVALDFNNAAAANAFFVNIWYLQGVATNDRLSDNGDQ
jgi:hypothetical protein